jgi:hypothetical protein
VAKIDCAALLVAIAARNKLALTPALARTDAALPGRWQLRIDALVSDFEKAIFRGEAEIR